MSHRNNGCYFVLKSIKRQITYKYTMSAFSIFMLVLVVIYLIYYVAVILYDLNKLSSENHNQTEEETLDLPAVEPIQFNEEGMVPSEAPFAMNENDVQTSDNESLGSDSHKTKSAQQDVVESTPVEVQAEQEPNPAKPVDKEKTKTDSASVAKNVKGLLKILDEKGVAIKPKFQVEYLDEDIKERIYKSYFEKRRNRLKEVPVESSDEECREKV